MGVGTFHRGGTWGGGWFDFGPYLVWLVGVASWEGGSKPKVSLLHAFFKGSEETNLSVLWRQLQGISDAITPDEVSRYSDDTDCNSLAQSDDMALCKMNPPKVNDTTTVVPKNLISEREQGNLGRKVRAMMSKWQDRKKTACKCLESNICNQGWWVAKIELRPKPEPETKTEHLDPAWCVAENYFVNQSLLICSDRVHNVQTRQDATGWNQLITQTEAHEKQKSEQWYQTVKLLTKLLFRECTHRSKMQFDSLSLYLS